LGTELSPADHVLIDPSHRFDGVLAELESVAGWKTARVQRPVKILGSLDGIETGNSATDPRRTTGNGLWWTITAYGLSPYADYPGMHITVPTAGEILRIKGVLILKRNATRDYFDFVALADHLGDSGVAHSNSHYVIPCPAEGRREPS